MSEAHSAAWPATFSDLVGAVREEVAGVLRKPLHTSKKLAQRYGISPTASALDSLVRRGGKRFRAALTVAGFACIKPRAAWTPAVQAGAAVELLHAYMLIQDDWMDGDATRRGGPSVHEALAAAYGDPRLGAISAVLASDLAWGMAMRLMAELDAPPARRVEAMSELLRCHQDVVLGQQLDVLYEAASAHERRSDIETVHALKTGSYTVTAPLLVGASIAGASQEEKDAFELFARPLGVAFQLRDDVLGVFGDPAATGKPLAGDLRAGKRTAVTDHAETLLTGSDLAEYRRVLGSRNASDVLLARVVEMLDRAGARQRVEKTLGKHCALARRRLAALDVPAQPRGWLEGAVSLVEGGT